MTDKQFNIEKKKYIKEVKSYFIGDFGTKNKFIHDLRSDIDGFIEENSVTDFKAVYDRFGEPKDIVKGFFDNADIKKIKRKINTTRAVVIGVTIILVMLGVFYTSAWIDAHRDNNGYNVAGFKDEINSQIQLIDFEGLL